MNKFLTFGIILLFIVSIVSPMVIGYDVETSNKDLIENKEETKSFGSPPEEEWNRTFGGSKKDGGCDVQQTSDGGYIVAGFTHSFGIGHDDFWLIKTDANGTEQWNKTFGGIGWEQATSVQEINGGGYVLSGHTTYGDGGWNIWLVKTDVNGDEQWNETYGGSGDDRGSSLQKTSDGGYIITGFTYSYGAGSEDVWLIKTDSNGDEEWNRTFGGSSLDGGESVQQTSDGGYIVIGWTHSYGPGDNNVWVIKTDAYGNEEWNLTFGKIDWGSVAFSGQQTNDGGYIVTGAIGQWKGSLLLLKIDENAAVQWNRTYSRSPVGWSVEQTFDGGYIITGRTGSPSGHGYSAVWLVKTDIYGNEQWNKTFYRTLNSRGWSVHQTSEGGFIIAGETDFEGEDLGNVWLIKVEAENIPPSSPIIAGRTSGKVGVEYQYNFSLSDPDDDAMYLRVDWGNGTPGPWQGPYGSNTTVSLNHTWYEKGTYTIRAKAKDEHGAESEWGTLDVTMPKNKVSTKSLFVQLFERFINRFSMLKQLLNIK